MVVRLATLPLLVGCSYSPSPASDDAGDGVPDGDAAPACTAIGHDEDGDLVDDACDPCPGIADATTDSDGDGIGDACDPDPAGDRDRLREFVAFTIDGEPTRWMARDGEWSWQADQLSFQDPSSCCNFRVIADSTPAALDAAIAFAAKIVFVDEPDESSSNNDRTHLGLLLNVHGPGNGGVACAIVRELDTDTVVYVNEPGPGETNEMASRLDLAIVDDRAYTLLFTYDPETRLATCRATGGGAPRTVQITLAAPPPPGPVGFEAMGSELAARVEYLAVYGRD